MNNLAPLHYVAFKNSTESALLLLERSAEIKPNDNSNKTPLHYAVLKNKRESTQLLLERGAEI